jgi:cation diffusion facilitator family transporter
VAAISIAVAASQRLFHPVPLERLGLGLGLSLAATAINGGVAYVLLGAGRRLRSITLRADAHHLLTDVWTSAGILLGLVLVKLTGWLVLDPIIALLVAVNIIGVGIKLLGETGSELLDRSLSKTEQKIITDLFSSYESRGLQFHALRTRRAGSHRFVSFHLLVPGAWTVQRGHDLCEEIESAIAGAMPDTYIFTHLEPLEDPSAWKDRTLDHNQSL